MMRCKGYGWDIYVEQWRHTVDKDMLTLLNCLMSYISTNLYCAIYIYNSISIYNIVYHVIL